MEFARFLPVCLLDLLLVRVSIHTQDVIEVLGSLNYNTAAASAAAGWPQWPGCLLQRACCCMLAA
jgi:hypothetical protein